MISSIMTDVVSEKLVGHGFTSVDQLSRRNGFIALRADDIFVQSMRDGFALQMYIYILYIYIFIYLFMFIIGFIGTPELTLWCSCRFFSKAKRPEYLSISFETVLLRSQHHFCLLCGHPAGKVEDSVPGHPECALLTIPPCRFVAFKAESTSLKGMDSHQLKIPALAH